MIASMTGFAALKGQGAGASWLWDLRSVNGKGLDLRLRLPEWIDGLEPLVRADLVRRIQRGNVALTLRVTRDGAEEPLRINRAVLAAVLSGLTEGCSGLAVGVLAYNAVGGPVRSSALLTVTAAPSAPTSRSSSPAMTGAGSR